MMNMQEVRAAVERGATLLDQIAPDWTLRVSTTTLNMGDCDRCMLGQLYGNYLRGLHAIGLVLGSKRTRTHGFAAYNKADYVMLTEAWRTVIKKRARRTMVFNGGNGQRTRTKAVAHAQ